MNIDEFRKEIIADEGCINEVYLDHLGLPTFGIGHLIREDDPEHGLELGTVISDSRIKAAFDSDVQLVLNDCMILYPDFNELPEEAQRVIANMMFNMGRPRLSKFKKMKEAVDARDWNAAGYEMIDSRWYKQVTNRAERLVQRIHALA